MAARYSSSAAALSLLLLSDSCLDPVCDRRIQRHQNLCLRPRLIFSTSDNRGSFKIKLSQVRPAFPAVRIEFDSPLKFNANFPGQPRGLEKPGAIRFLSVDPSEPQVVKPILRRHRDCFFARRDALIPILQFETRAAQQVISLRSGSSPDFLIEDFDRLISAARSQKFLR